MTEMKTIKCDRCQVKFDIPESEEPEFIIIKCLGEEKAYDLCDDCVAVVNLMISEVKKFNNLSQSILTEKYGKM